MARYSAFSAALVDRERARLAEALEREDRIATAWALRSVADMMKGLIDVGADFPAPHPISGRRRPTLRIRLLKCHHATLYRALTGAASAA